MMEQCKDCAYWRSSSATSRTADWCCHYMLDEGKMKRIEGDRCLSAAPKGSRKRKRSFDVPGAQQGL